MLPAVALAEPGSVAAPAIPGVAALPGPVVDPGKPAAEMKLLKTTPDVALAGTGITIVGSGLPADKDVTLTWGTANVDWMLDARADSVDYLGRKATKFAVQLARTHTSASGAFSVKLKAPQDFGGLHDIYAVVDGRAGREGRLPDRPLGVDEPEEGPDRDDDHDHRTRASARRCTRAAGRCCTTTSTSAP